MRKPETSFMFVFVLEKDITMLKAQGFALSIKGNMPSLLLSTAIGLLARSRRYTLALAMQSL